nr:MAG TPA: hypothetical protein [Caudoviricetes sp.]
MVNFIGTYPFKTFSYIKFKVINSCLFTFHDH